MALNPGTRLGPYEIVSAIGAGGMGEVYKAIDSRLSRTVAIKVLPSDWADNAEMKQRFQREAETIASLKHPHICVLHDVGETKPGVISGAPNSEMTPGFVSPPVTYLVMEYVEGETLARRLERGPLPLGEALKVAIAIADALDKAHRHGVVHRDVKPANVMLTEAGPKLLDFGLARWSPGALVPGLQARTPATPITQTGMILGTLQYMAPEQIDGLEADGRTDIFAFGAMVHEMMTGRKAFEGKSQVQLMTAIAASDPEPLSKTHPATPGALVHVVNVCLAKDPKDRWQTARDLLAELEWVAEGGAETLVGTPIPAASRKRQRVLRTALVTAVLLAAGTAGPAWLYWRGPAEPEFRFRTPIAYGDQPATGNPNLVANGQFALSPTGRSIAYVTQGGRGAPRLVYVRPIGSITPQPLAGTEEAQFPFWSADGRSVAFAAGGKLKKVEAAGGLPQDICDLPPSASAVSNNAPVPWGGTWNGDGTIVIGSTKGLLRVSHQGGTPEAITTLDSAETGHAYPHFLPDGRHFLYAALSGDAAAAKVVAIFVGALDSKDRTRVMAAESPAQYVEPGFLLFYRNDTLYAQPFSAKTMTLSGEPVRVAGDVDHFSASPNGVLAYDYNSLENTAPATTQNAAYQLAWGERTGQVVETVGPPGNYQGVSLSPDGKRIAVHRHDGSGGDVFVVEPKPRDSFTRLTIDASHDNSMPIWSPSGDRVVYSALQNGKWGLYQTLSDASGTAELLLESELPKAPMSWSPDGKRIVFWVQDPKTTGDLWVLDMEAARDRKAAPFIHSTFNEMHGQISPDGKWIAYTTNKTDGRNEIFVRPFPSGSGEYQVSNNGGWFPRWRRDSQELYYKAIGNEATPGVQLPFNNPRGPYYAVSVRAKGAAFEWDKPRDILNFRTFVGPHSGGSYQTYDVSADGRRVLYLQDASSAQTAAAPTTQIAPDPTNGLIIALNWVRGLRK